MKKTIREWLMMLKDEHRDKAIKNMTSERGEVIELDLGDALANAFNWSETDEGGGFWGEIYDDICNDRYFATHQQTPEDCVAKAKESLYGLPEDADKRKEYPIYSGFLCYFPNAIAEVANLSCRGNAQHHADKPLHWDMDKSADELDALMRHTLDGITATTKEQVIDESTRRAWRAMADLERKLTGKCKYEQEKES